MSDVTVNIRLPGYHSPVQVLIPLTYTATQARDLVASDYHLKEAEQYSLVISPTTSSSGGILDAHTPWTKFQLSAETVLELWAQPYVINVAVQAPNAHPQHVKRVALDYGTPLVHLVPILQHCLPVLGAGEFAFQAAQLGPDGATTNATWLCANESLQAQKFRGECHLLLVPMDILAAMPARSLVQKADREGWLFKESHKNGRLTPKKRRYCILRSAFLFYFKQPKDSHPAGVIPLEFYSVKKLKKEPRGTLIALRRTYKGFESKRADAFLFFATDEKTAIVDWFEDIRKRCVNVNERLFGVALDRVVLGTGNAQGIPSFIDKCISSLSKPSSLKSVGLFRLSGSAAAVAKLRDQFDQAQDVSLDDVDCDTVASLLKLFFRELPEPLFPFEFYDLMVASHNPTKNKQKQQYEMLHTTSQLPRYNYDILKYLLHFLALVSSQSDVNKMTNENLGRVWASNLLRKKKIGADGGVGDVAAINHTMQSLIECHQQLYHIDDRAAASLSMRHTPSVHDIVASPVSEATAGDDDDDTPPTSPRADLQAEIFAQPPQQTKPSTLSRASTTAVAPSQALARKSEIPRSHTSVAAQNTARTSMANPTVARTSVASAAVNRAAAAAGDAASKYSGVLKKGFLTKQGGNRKNWKSRFFVLTPVNLSYYENCKNLEKQQPKGVIALFGSTKIQLEPSKKSNCFSVMTPTRTFYICASNDRELQEWHSAISGAVQRLANPQKTEKPKKPAMSPRGVEKGTSILGPKRAQPQPPGRAAAAQKPQQPAAASRGPPPALSPRIKRPAVSQGQPTSPTSELQTLRTRCATLERRVAELEQELAAERAKNK